MLEIIQLIQESGLRGWPCFSIAVAIILFASMIVNEISRCINNLSANLKNVKINQIEQKANVEKYKHDNIGEVRSLRTTLSISDDLLDKAKEEKEDLVSQIARLQKAVMKLTFISDPADKEKVDEIIEDLHDIYQ